MQKYIIPIFVPHFGCPHRCVFCDQAKISGHKNLPNVSDTIEEYLSYFKDKKLPIEVAFYGGSFTAIKYETQKFLLEQVLPYINAGVVQSIRLSTRPDSITNEILELLKEHHVQTIELGVQSLDEEVLELSCRGHDRKSVFNSAKKIKEWGFMLGIQIMPGLPGDTFEKIYKTTLDVIKIKPDFVRIYPTVVIKGTALEEKFLKGKFKPLTLDEAIEITSQIYIEFIKNGIKVIRTGLQPTEDLLKGEVVAGPFHPAFGELVKGEVVYKILSENLDKFLDKYPQSNFINIFVPSKKISIFLGHKSVNRHKIFKRYGEKVNIKGDPSLKNEVIIVSELGKETIEIKI